METRFLSSITEISANAWHKLWRSDYPFIQHGFLRLLETSGSTTRETGWQPHHLIVEQNAEPVAALPLFIKHHSYGEYVFDWSWADAYAQHDLPYYPKLLSAIPFTPATGPRLALEAGMDAQQCQFALAAIEHALASELERLDGSGFHCLFPDATSQTRLAQLSDPPLLPRYGYQFHWFNDGYRSFDDFLMGFTSRKRKTLNRERRKVSEQGIAVAMCPGEQISAQDWQLFAALYQRTYLKNSGRYGYLNADFFRQLVEHLPGQVLLARADRAGKMIAGALYFRDQTTLYGRYWGTREDLDGLHFECCYYQGIEYAIAQKLRRFDPGAQGEHKIQRGFTPIFTCSFHHLRHPQFHRAVAEFVTRERVHVEAYLADARGYLPFKEDVPATSEQVLLQAPHARDD